MARGNGAGFEMDASGAFGVMGTVDGFQARVQTPYFVNSVLRLTHSRLADFFDEWLDGLAHGDPDSFMHVYEWPHKFRDYGETVGNPQHPEAKLWVHTFSGKGGQGQASFQFLPVHSSGPGRPDSSRSDADRPHGQDRRSRIPLQGNGYGIWIAG
jgi:hypothetical protein